MVSGMSAPHPQLAPPGPPAAMMTPAQPDGPLRTGVAPIAGPERVPSSRSDPADGGHQDADQQHTGQGGVPDATWAVFQELRQQFEVLLPLGVIRGLREGGPGPARFDQCRSAARDGHPARRGPPRSPPRRHR